MENNNDMNEKKRIDFATLADETGKGMKSLLDKAKDGIVKVVDQNDDGSFDGEDVSVIADAISDAAKNTADTVREALEIQKREIERRTLRPIFEDDLSDAEFTLTKLIRITSKDKKHSESEVCEGSIGHITVHKDMKVVNIYRNNLELFGITLSPVDSAELYYVDPTDRNMYIELDEYFNHMKVERINELESLAQDLGASRIKITYKESKTSFSKKHHKSKIVGILEEGQATAEQTIIDSYTDAETIGISTEVKFKNIQAPIEPSLNYLKRDPEVRGIINMRLKKNASEVSGKTYRSESSKTLGMKLDDAKKIDSVLKSMNIKGNGTVTDEMKTEMRRFFEYIIEF